MKNLLGRLDLRSRLYGDDHFDFAKGIDYDRVSICLRDWRCQSMEFLKLALEGKKGEDIPHYDNEKYLYEN